MKEKHLVSEAFGGCSDPGDTRDFPTSSGMEAEMEVKRSTQDKGSQCLWSFAPHETGKCAEGPELQHDKVPEFTGFSVLNWWT